MNWSSQPPGVAAPDATAGLPSVMPVASSLGHRPSACATLMLAWLPRSGSLKPSRTFPSLLDLVEVGGGDVGRAPDHRDEAHARPGSRCRWGWRPSRSTRTRRTRSAPALAPVTFQVATPFRSLVRVTGGGVRLLLAASAVGFGRASVGDRPAPSGAGSRRRPDGAQRGRGRLVRVRDRERPARRDGHQRHRRRDELGRGAGRDLRQQPACRACPASRARAGAAGAPPGCARPAVLPATWPSVRPASAAGTATSGSRPSSRSAGIMLGPVAQAPRAVPDVPGQPLAPQRARLAVPARW